MTNEHAKLTHFNDSGEAHMVDVGAKPITHRVAVASGTITMRAETLAVIESGDSKKGDVIGIARVAAIMAAKKTSELIPLCHPLAISKVRVDFEVDHGACAICCTARVETHGKTGVEMEALTAVQIGLLTIYDMCKAIDRDMVMGGTALEHKRGGRSGTWSAGAEP